MKTWLIGVAFGVFALVAHAVETIRVVSPEYPGYIDKAGKGYYVELLSKVYSTPQYKLVIEIVPFKRAQIMVAEGQADVIPGTNDEPGLRTQLSTQVTDIDVVDAAVLKSKFPNWQGERSLENMRTSALIGYAFDKYTSVKMKYDEKSNLAGMLQMLPIGRLDAVLDYETELRPLVDALPNKADFEIKVGVFKRPLRFGFSPSPRGKELSALFDAEVAKLKASGELKRMMQRYPDIRTSAYPE